MQASNIVAWWGAIIATTVLIWDVLKWLKTGAKIKARIKLLALYSPEIERESKIENVCYIELINTGTTATTLLNIELTNKNKKGQLKVSLTKPAFNVLHGKSIPCTINPGEAFICHIPLDSYKNLVTRGKPEFHFDLSHKESVVIFRPSKRVNNEVLAC